MRRLSRFSDIISDVVLKQVVVQEIRGKTVYNFRINIALKTSAKAAKTK